jgi:hypothetical protein
LLVKAHGLLDYESQHGATGQTGNAAGVKPSHLLWCELHGKGMR